MIPHELSESDLSHVLRIEESAQFSPWSDDVFRRCFESGYFFWGLGEAEKLMGFIIYSLQVGECHILNLCVHSDHQGRGIGRSLLSYGLDQARQQGAGSVYLEVRRSNAVAICLYKSVGFVQVGERKGYYPHENGREDALIFGKDLGVLQ